MTTTVKVSFWRIFWASLLSGMLLSIIGWIFWISIFSSLTPEEEQKDRTVLRLKLSGQIADRTSSKIDKSAISIDSKIGLADILNGFEEAKEDKRIKGIYLDLANVSCGYATAREIRSAITDFQSSGKFCIAYLHGEVITQKQYYIASAAKKCYGFKGSNMEFLGLGAELTFFKKLFDKVGLEMQIIKGSNNDFKSAVEPLFRENMSDSSRLQVNRYLQSIWSTISNDISKSRKIDIAKLNTLAENATIRSVEDAVSQKLIDASYYEDEVVAIIEKEAGIDDLAQMQTFEEYAKSKFKDTQLNYDDGTRNQVAVIVAEGGISVNGDEFSSKRVCRYFKEVRNNKNVKVVVFRVNSPGGSALASEEIWREVSLTAKVKKVIVSMGDVAASGGYYVSTAANYIFAEPNTITGSIGVFGTIPYTGALLENNLGLTFDRVQTHSHAVLSLNRRLTPEELAIIQNGVDDIYLQFKQRVADGRKLSLQQVERLARGRVWTGEDALKIGLVDEMGGLNDAIAYAIKIAKVKDANIRYYPIVEENALDDLLENLASDEDLKASVKDDNMQLMTKEWMDRIKVLQEFNGIQMRLPYEIDIN